MKWLSEEWYYTLLIVVVFLAAYLLSKLFKYIIGKYIDKQANKLATEVTNYNFLKNAITFIVFLIATIIIFFLIPSLQNVGVTLLASAGIIAAAIGFASQQAFSNIISGIFIVIFKPFRVGDITEIQGNLGTIEEITLRHTVIRNYQNRRVIIPNSVISNDTILNSSITDKKICNFWEVDISYESNVDRAIAIIREEAENHPNLLDNRSEEDVANGKDKVTIRVIALGEYGIKIRAYLWSEDNFHGWVLKCDLNVSVKKKFDESGIEIPYPHRTIVYKQKRAGDEISE